MIRSGVRNTGVPLWAFCTGITPPVGRGADHVEAFSNFPPWWMTLSGSAPGAVDGGDNLRPGD